MFGFILFDGLNVVLICFNLVNNDLLKNVGLYLLWNFLLCLFYIKLLCFVINVIILLEIWCISFFCFGLYKFNVGLMCNILVLMWLNMLYCKLWLFNNVWNFIMKLVRFFGGMLVFLVKVMGFWLFLVLFNRFIDFFCMV